MRGLLLFVMTLTVIGCSARSNDGAGAFEQPLGVATEVELQDLTNRILTLHNFEIEREVTGSTIYVETRWLQRAPFNDERALGIEAAQVRVVIRGRGRSSTSLLGPTYTVTMRVEQRVRLSDSNDWSAQTVTESARRYANEIFADMKREFDIGVHRF